MNLLLIGIYLSPSGSKADIVELIRQLKELLDLRSVHDCVILFGDFNIRLPRGYQDIVGPFAQKQLTRTLSTKQKDNNNISFSIN